MIDENTIYNDKEKEIIEEDERTEQIKKLIELEEQIKEKEDKLNILKEINKELDEIKEEPEDILKVKRRIRKKLLIGVSLVLVGVLIILWASILILSNKPNIGFGLFATVMLCFFGGAVALKNNEM